MIKSLSALAMLSLLGAAVIAVPGFSPQVEAGETAALAKADRLPVRLVESSCSQQNWPNYAASCLRNGRSGATVNEARLVTTPR
jgi:hypothetical protein